MSSPVAFWQFLPDKPHLPSDQLSERCASWLSNCVRRDEGSCPRRRLEAERSNVLRLLAGSTAGLGHGKSSWRGFVLSTAVGGHVTCLQEVRHKTVEHTVILSFSCTVTLK